MMTTCVKCKQEPTTSDETLCRTCNWGEEERIASLERKYGLPRGWYGQQGDQCSICKRSGMKMVIDHNHQTGEVRGLLCHACNVGIGNLGDDVDRVRSALEYLIKSGTGYYQPIANVHLRKRTDIPEGHGHCRTCDMVKSKEHFYARKSGLLYRTCKDCIAKRYRESVSK